MGRQSWKVSFRIDNERRERQAGDDGEGGTPCARGQRCASATRERGGDGKWTLKPAVGSRAFCDRDDLAIASALRGFPDGHALLLRMLGYHPRREVQVRSPFGPGCLLRVDLDELARVMVDSAMSWLERVAEVPASGLEPPDSDEWRAKAVNGGAHGLVTYAVPRLAERVSALTALEAGPMLRPSLIAVVLERPAPAADLAWLDASGAEAGLEVLALGYLWRSVLGLTPAPRDDILGVDCESCGRRSLRRALPPLHDDDPSYFAECAECGYLLTDKEFAEWTDRLVRFYRRRVTPAMLASAGLRGNETPAIRAAVT